LLLDVAGKADIKGFKGSTVKIGSMSAMPKIASTPHGWNAWPMSPYLFILAIASSQKGQCY